MKDKGPQIDSIDGMMKNRNLSGSDQDAFKTGFTEGFMKSISMTQRTQGMAPLTRLSCYMLLVACCINVIAKFMPPYMLLVSGVIMNTWSSEL